MLNVIILFDMRKIKIPFSLDLEKIYNPKKYKLYLIVHPYCLSNDENYKKYFEKVIITRNFSFKYILTLIEGLYLKGRVDFFSPVEYTINLCGKLKKHFGLIDKGYSRFVNKHVMKQALNGSGINYPPYIIFDKKIYKEKSHKYIDSILKKLNFPLFAKPLHEAGCIGTTKLINRKELENWSDKIINSRLNYEVDEFIDGRLFHCDSFIKSSKVIFTQVSECSRPCFDFIEGKTKGSIVLRDDDQEAKELKKMAEDALYAMGTPQNGVTHLEIFKNNEGALFFLEVGYRHPGCLIPAMYKKFLNVDIAEENFLLQMDMYHVTQPKIGVFSAWVAFPVRRGKMKTANQPIINSDFDLKWYVQAGDLMDRPKIGRNYAGTILLWNTNYEELKKDFEYLNQFEAFEVEPVLKIVNKEINPMDPIKKIKINKGSNELYG